MELYLPESHFRYLRYCGVYHRPADGSRLRVRYACVAIYMFLFLNLVYTLENRSSGLMEICEEIMFIQACPIVMVKFNMFFSDRQPMYALMEAFKNIHVHVGEVEEDLHRFVKCHVMHAKLRRIYILSLAVGVLMFIANAVSASVSLSLQSGELRFVTPTNLPYNYQHPVVFGLTVIFIIDVLIIGSCISMTVDKSHTTRSRIKLKKLNHILVFFESESQLA